MRALLLIIGVLWACPSQAAGLLVIASSQVPDSEISIRQLADIYLLKKNFWANNTQVVPVNREASSDEREKFSEIVFNLSPQELAEHLNQLRFKGKLPPLIQNSDEAIVSFVRNVPGAIGYISASQVPIGVKVLLRLQ